jgi:hypothetical protein
VTVVLAQMVAGSLSISISATGEPSAGVGRIKNDAASTARRARIDAMHQWLDRETDVPPRYRLEDG